MILIRADANERIGAGHVMRCLSIARAMAQRGKEVLFVTADHQADSLIHAGGFPSICMNSPWREMEQEPIGQLIAEKEPELVLVDSYFVTPGYLSGLSALTRTAYLDDLNAAPWDVDFLINYNIFSTEMDYSANIASRTTLILGPRYAPLRPEFQEVEPHCVKTVTDILVSAGGADPERVTERLMERLCPNWNAVRFHFVVGALNPRLDKIKARSAKTPNALLQINVKKMSELMCLCDLAIAAAGSTLYELCACGTPTVCYTLADNQLPAARVFSARGMMRSAGDCRNNDRFSARVEAHLRELSEKKELRQEQSRTMQTLVDGKGAARLAEVLMSGA